MFDAIHQILIYMCKRPQSTGWPEGIKTVSVPRGSAPGEEPGDCPLLL